MLAIFAFVLTALVFSANVVAQDDGGLTEQQQCALKCATDSIAQSGCPAGDTACLCTSSAYKAAVATCVGAAGCNLTTEDVTQLLADGCPDTGNESGSASGSVAPNTGSVSVSGSKTAPGAPGSQTSTPASKTPAGSNASGSPTQSGPPSTSQSGAAEMNAVRGGGAAAAALGLVFALL
ncbi:hypothetical protein C8J57DRAFT_1296071 [Mycena rebaudengoi]|nr:hypothetical protein C8J57DRAFT_1296071 [Mycena rebaudengoi]